MTSKPYTVYAVQGRTHSTWKRALLWGTLAVVVLLVAAAGGSYLWFRSQVIGANQRIDPEVIEVLSSEPVTTLPTTVVSTGSVSEPPPESPRSMNILVLGSDHRPDEDEEYGRSDTIIMVHIDPDEDYLSIMSLPRDLRVNIPGYGKEKINAAFAFKGPSLTIQTVEGLTGIDINHYMEVDFEAFKDITDALGGVYVDVDRRYYNDDPQWELIKLAPGYQLLHGADALDYVRFRHDLNADFGRMERQQRFLAAMREQAMGWDLAFKLPGLISALFSNISTDLGANDILRLAYWAVGLDGSRMRQVSLVGDTQTIDDISYVVVTERTLANAVAAFVTPPGGDEGSSTTAVREDPVDSEPSSSSASSTDAESKTLDLGGIAVDVLNGNGRDGEAAKAEERLTDLGAEVVTVDNAASSDHEATVIRHPRGDYDQALSVARALGATSIEETSTVRRVTAILGRDFELPTSYDSQPSVGTIPNASEWKALATMIPFALQAPSYLPEGYVYYDRMPPTGGTYDIEVGSGTKPALKMIYRLRQNGQKTDQYMGITATKWTDAPAASKGQQVEAGGVTYTVVGTDKKVDHVWWKTDGVLYWVSNTLSYLLSREEMLKVAQSTVSMPQP